MPKREKKGERRDKRDKRREERGERREERGERGERREERGEKNSGTVAGDSCLISRTPHQSENYGQDLMLPSDQRNL